MCPLAETGGVGEGQLPGGSGLADADTVSSIPEAYSSSNHIFIGDAGLSGAFSSAAVLEAKSTGADVRLQT